MEETETILSVITLVVGFLITASIVFWSVRLGITPTPSTSKIKQSLEALLPDKVDGTIFEAGSGFGGLLILLSSKYPEKTIVGIERSPIPFWISKIRCLHLKNVSIYLEDFHKSEWKNAGLIVCYVYPGGMEKLSEAFKKYLRDECIVLSHTFRLPGWQPECILKANDLYKSPIYLYRVNLPSHREGSKSPAPFATSDKQPTVQEHN
ncbi:hypothetical protein [Endozoicomonas arenosclerae]|uniref:hypothetical protein n=1 Tax=Endozoicomonas arenosclerae TaxID=1633495 RepID=UPI0007845EED|nr:hypothetical protein [Endozoicomonas arenosclerae]